MHDSPQEARDIWLGVAAFGPQLRVFPQRGLQRKFGGLLNKDSAQLT